MRNLGRTGAALVLAAAMLAACTSSDDPPESVTVDPTADEQVDAPDFSPGEDQSPEPIPGQDAAANALSTAADELGGLAFELDRADDEDVWEVSVAVDQDKVEIHVSADGAMLVSQESVEPLDAEDRRRLDVASVSASEAAVFAAQAIGGTVQEVELDDDGDDVVWEIELRTTDGANTDVSVDAVTGEVR